MQAEEAAAEMKENLDTSKVDSKYCFLSQGSEGKATLNFLNPDLGEGMSCWDWGGIGAYCVGKKELGG